MSTESITKCDACGEIAREGHIHGVGFQRYDRNTRSAQYGFDACSVCFAKLVEIATASLETRGGPSPKEIRRHLLGFEPETKRDRPVVPAG